MQGNENTLFSESNTYRKLIKSSLPMMGMMIISNIYSVIDGIFVSNVVGDIAFASVNIIMPLIMVLSAFGFMVGSGGSALIAKTLGEKDTEKANKYFSMFVSVLLIVGIILTVTGELLLRPIAQLLGADNQTLDGCIEYGRIMIAFIAIMMLQYAFQSFLVVAQKQKFAFVLSIAVGVTNILLDYLFVSVFQFGLTGAAIATVMSWCVAGIIPLLYFIFGKKCFLRLRPAKIQLKPVLQGCYNGMSEMFTNIALSIANMLYISQLLRISGNDGVVSFGIIMYVSYIFSGVFTGYAMGVSPIIGYNYGAKNNVEIKNILKKKHCYYLIFGNFTNKSCRNNGKTPFKYFR